MRQATLLLLALLLALPLAAAVSDRQPVSFPQSDLVLAGPGRVVAGGTGMFLVHGQRVTRDGVKIDETPLVGADGYAVGCPDGWLVVNPSYDTLYVRHLGAEGAPELTQTIPALGQFVAAASN